MIKTDVLVIGSGAAGLMYALRLSKKFTDKKIIIITKSQADESNTKYAQGGVAVVWDKLKDDFQSHVEDTLRAGDGKCRSEVVEMVVGDAPIRIRELIEYGVLFDLDETGDYDLGREGGHSQHRVIHHKDNTGEAIEKVLLKKAKEVENIEILEFCLAIDLLRSKDENRCYGADVLDIKKKSVVRILANTITLATGGCGAVYKNTTNPATSTGDGIALANRAGIKVNNMQYIQFHPTVIYEESGVGKQYLITEAMRGAGAKLLNKKHERFMSKYDNRLELASRDIVSRAIHYEMELCKSKYVYLDCRDIDKDKLLAHFPNIYKECKQRGYNLFKDLLPIVPASHYLCGGIDVNMEGKTELENVFAIGECSNTGLHGANRLASNSLLEALVYGHRAAEATIGLLQSECQQDKNPIFEDKLPVWIEMDINTVQQIEKIRENLKQIMSSNVGILRNNKDLNSAKEEIEALQKTFSSFYNQEETNEGLEDIRNRLALSQLIVQQSMDQIANAGTFFNTDLA